MLTVGFVVTPGFPVMSLGALSVFEFANFSAEKKLYDVQVLSEDGMSVPSASGTTLETTAFGDAHFDTVYKSALDLSDIVRCNRLRAASLMVWRCVADLKPGVFDAPLRGCGA
jgi:transcriptional regulator GlxA family with amidase domain